MMVCLSAILSSTSGLLCLANMVTKYNRHAMIVSPTSMIVAKNITHTYLCSHSWVNLN